MREEMTVKKAKEIVHEQEHQLNFSQRFNTQTVSQEYAYLNATGFIQGYSAGIREAAEICNKSVTKEKTGDGLGEWRVCNKTPYELRDEILSLLPDKKEVIKLSLLFR